MGAAASNFRSLKHKLLFPLLLVGLLVALMVVLVMHQLFQMRLTDSLRQRSALVANMVNYAAESIQHAGELQRIVSSIGAEEDVLDVLVVAGNPKRVIAPTELAWFNKSLSELPESEVAEDVKKALRIHANHSHFNTREHLFDFSAPLVFDQTSLSGIEAGDGAAVVHLDTRPMEANILYSTLLFSGLFLLGLCMLAAIGYVLIRRVVLRPLARIGELVEVDAAADSQHWNEVDTHDEIGLLAQSLRGAREHIGIVIGELEQQKEALRTSEDRYRLITAYSSDIISRITVEGVFNYVSPASAMVLGYEPEQMLGKSLFDWIHPHDIAIAEFKLDKVLNSYMIDTLTCRICNVENEYIWVEISLRGLHGRTVDYGGDMIGVIRDITERKRVEHMKNEFISTVSHELRTPLTSIYGALGLMSGGALGEMPVQVKQMMEIAHRNSQRLMFLINDLLDMEKLASGKMKFEMEDVPLMPIVEQSLENSRTYGAERNVRLAVTQAMADAVVNVDSQRLMQVLSNLLSNAIKYSPLGNMVEISVAQHDLSVRVSVIDHGSGVPEAFHASIFTKFSQADSSDTRQKGGTGLGLSITKELVELMGGKIGFNSVEGQGACFYFDLRPV